MQWSKLKHLCGARRSVAMVSIGSLCPVPFMLEMSERGGVPSEMNDGMEPFRNEQDAVNITVNIFRMKWVGVGKNMAVWR